MTLAGTFGLLAAATLVAQQQPPPGGGGGMTGPAFSWLTTTDGKEHPTFWKAYQPPPNHTQLETKWRMGGGGTLTYYHPTPWLSHRISIRVATNGVFPIEEEWFHAPRSLAGHVYGQWGSKVGDHWELSSRCDPGDDPNTPSGGADLQRKFDPGCQIALYFRVELGDSNSSTVYHLGNKTATAP